MSKSNQKPLKSKDHLIFLFQLCPLLNLISSRLIVSKNNKHAPFLKAVLIESLLTNDFLRWAKPYSVGMKGKEN